MPSIDQPDSTDAVAHLAKDLRSVIGRLRRKLQAQYGSGDLTPSQTAVLLRLDEEESATTAQLARGEGMRPQSMGTIVSSLVEAGLIHGAPDPLDGRQTLLSLTPKCRTLLTEVRAARQDWLVRNIQTKFSMDDVAQVKAALALIERLLDQ